MKNQIKPKEVLFVADAMTGQDAVNIAKHFNERLGVDGVILTKMDGDAEEAQPFRSRRSHKNRSSLSAWEKNWMPWKSSILIEWFPGSSGWVMC